MPRLEQQRRKLITEVPENIVYDLTAIEESRSSFGATLEEAARQVGVHLETKLSRESIADIIAGYDPEFNVEGPIISSWIKGAKPMKVEGAKSVARAFRLPENYFTRFYETVSTSPYEKS